MYLPRNKCRYILKKTYKQFVVCYKYVTWYFRPIADFLLVHELDGLRPQLMSFFVYHYLAQTPICIVQIFVQAIFVLICLMDSFIFGTPLLKFRSGWGCPSQYPAQGKQGAGFGGPIYTREPWTGIVYYGVPDTPLFYQSINKPFQQKLCSLILFSTWKEYTKSATSRYGIVNG